VTPEHYRRQYLETASAKPPAGAALPKLAAYHWFPLPESPRPVGLVDLMNAGVECGHGESLALLQRRAREYDDAGGDLLVRISHLTTR